MIQKNGLLLFLDKQHLMKVAGYIIIGLLLIVFGLYLFAPVNVPAGTIITANKNEDLHLDRINLPGGFKIEVYVDEVENARSMSLSPDGVLYVGTRSKGNVYGIRDGKVNTIMTDGDMPNGVAYKDGDLYVAEVNRILRFDDIGSTLENPGEPTIINDSYPTDTHHGWKYIAFGPDGKLYVPVGAPCNICESEDDIYTSITRINADGSGREIVHRGIRNTVGFTWNPEDDKLWFTDNGRDMMGDEKPACELNKADRDGLHFGYPYCYQGDLPDPKYGDKRDCSEFVAPSQNLGPHTAPLGVEFYTPGMFPDKYENCLFIAEHGSWNRRKKIGYRVSMVCLDENKQSRGYEVFANG